MNHGDLIRNHILENWIFPNETARKATTGLYATYDIGKIAYQQDTGAYWRLTATTPTWVAFTPATATTSVTATPTNPGGITSTSGVMAGLGVAFTPIRTGRLLLTVTGSVANSLASVNSKLELRFGGATPPVFNSGPTGSIVGKAVNMANNANTAGMRVPVALVGVITNAGIGVGYWMDLCVTATGGTITINDLSVVVIEL